MTAFLGGGGRQSPFCGGIFWKSERGGTSPASPKVTAEAPVSTSSIDAAVPGTAVCACVRARAPLSFFRVSAGGVRVERLTTHPRKPTSQQLRESRAGRRQERTPSYPQGVEYVFGLRDGGERGGGGSGRHQVKDQLASDLVQRPQDFKLGAALRASSHAGPRRGPVPSVFFPQKLKSPRS